MLPAVHQYLKNVTVSTKYKAIEDVKSSIPIVYSYKEVNQELIDEARKTLKDRRMFRQFKTYAKSSDLYKTLDQAKKRAKQQLRTGKFYDPKKEDAAYNKYMGLDEINSQLDDLDNLDNLDADSGKDESLDSLNKSPELDTGRLTSSFNSSMKSGSDRVANATLDAAEITSETIKTTASMNYIQSLRMTKVMDLGIQDISSKLRNVIEFNNTKLNTHIQNSTAFFKSTTDLLTKQNAMIQEMLEMHRNSYNASRKKNGNGGDSSNVYESLINPSGAVDLKSYGNQIKRNFKNTSLYSYGEMAMNFKDVLTANPMQFVIDMGLSMLGKDKVQKGLKNLQKTLTGGFAQFLNVMDRWSSSDSTVKSTLGSLFRVRNNTAKKVSTNEYEKGPLQFNGIANKSIIEVIPGYLARIEAALTGNIGNERLFNFKSGKWTNTKSVRKNLEKQITDYSGSGVSDFNKQFRSIYSKIDNKHYKYKTSSKNKKGNEVFTEEDIDLSQPAAAGIKQSILDYVIQQVSQGVELLNGDIKIGRDEVEFGKQFTKANLNLKSHAVLAALQIVRAMYAGVPKSDLAILRHDIRSGKHGTDRLVDSIDENDVRMKMFNKSTKGIINDSDLGNSMIGGGKYLADISKKMDTIISIMNGSNKTPADKYNHIKSFNSNKPLSSKKSKKNSNKKIPTTISSSSSSSTFRKSSYGDKEYDFDNMDTDYTKSMKFGRITDIDDNSKEFSAFMDYLSKLKDLDKLDMSSAAAKKFLIHAKSMSPDTNNDEYNRLIRFTKTRDFVVGTMGGFHSLPDEIKGFVLSAFSQVNQNIQRIGDINSITDAIANELMDDDKNSSYSQFAGKNIFDKLSKAKGFDKFKVLQSYISNIVSMPGDILGGVIGKVDSIIYDFFFSKDQKVDSKGKPVKGFFNRIMFEISDSFETAKKWLKEKLISDESKEKFKSTVKGEAGKIVGGLKGSVHTVMSDIKGNAATGLGYVPATGLYTLSKGEAVIPSTKNPNNPFRGSSSISDDIKSESNVLKRVHNINSVLGGFATGTEGASQVADSAKDIYNGVKQGVIDASTKINNLVRGKTVNEKPKKETNPMDGAWKYLKKEYPSIFGSALVYGAIGGVAAGPLGLLVGGTLGATNNVLKHSTSFNQLLFGDTETKGLTGRINIKKMLPKAITDYFEKQKKNIKSIRDYSVVGGTIGGMAGGPLGLAGGVIMGALAGHLRNNEEARIRLFGERGAKAPKAIREYFKTHKGAVKGLGMGAVAGGLVGGPLGIAGGILVGSALSMDSVSSKIKKFLLGDKDDKIGGLIGGIGDALMTPIKSIGDSISDYMRTNFFEPLTNAMKPVGKLMQVGAKDIFKKIGNMIERLRNPSLKMPWFKALSPLMKKNRWLRGAMGGAMAGFTTMGPMGALLGSALGGVVGATKLDKMAGKLIGKVGKLPGKALNAIGRRANKSLIMSGDTDMDAASALGYMADNHMSFGNSEKSQNMRNTYLATANSSAAELSMLRAHVRIIQAAKSNNKNKFTTIAGELQTAVRTIDGLSLTEMKGIMKAINEVYLTASEGSPNDTKKVISQSMGKIESILRGSRSVNDSDKEKILALLKKDLPLLSSNTMDKNKVLTEEANLKKRARQGEFTNGRSFDIGELDKTEKFLTKNIDYKTANGESEQGKALTAEDAAMLEQAKHSENIDRNINESMIILNYIACIISGKTPPKEIADKFQKLKDEGVEKIRKENAKVISDRERDQQSTIESSIESGMVSDIKYTNQLARDYSSAVETKVNPSLYKRLEKNPEAMNRMVRNNKRRTVNIMGLHLGFKTNKSLTKKQIQFIASLGSNISNTQIDRITRLNNIGYNLSEDDMKNVLFNNDIWNSRIKPLLDFKYKISNLDEIVGMDNDTFRAFKIILKTSPWAINKFSQSDMIAMAEQHKTDIYDLNKKDTYKSTWSTLTTENKAAKNKDNKVTENNTKTANQNAPSVDIAPKKDTGTVRVYDSVLHKFLEFRHTSENATPVPINSKDNNDALDGEKKEKSKWDAVKEYFGIKLKEAKGLKDKAKDKLKGLKDKIKSMPLGAALMDLMKTLFPEAAVAGNVLDLARNIPGYSAARNVAVNAGRTVINKVASKLHIPGIGKVLGNSLAGDAASSDISGAAQAAEDAVETVSDPEHPEVEIGSAIVKKLTGVEAAIVTLGKYVGNDTSNGSSISDVLPIPGGGGGGKTPPGKKGKGGILGRIGNFIKGNKKLGILALGLTAAGLLGADASSPDDTNPNQPGQQQQPGTSGMDTVGTALTAGSLITNGGLAWGAHNAKTEATGITGGLGTSQTSNAAKTAEATMQKDATSTKVIGWVRSVMQSIGEFISKFLPSGAAKTVGTLTEKVVEKVSKTPALMSGLVAKLGIRAAGAVPVLGQAFLVGQIAYYYYKGFGDAKNILKIQDGQDVTFMDKVEAGTCTCVSGFLLFDLIDPSTIAEMFAPVFNRIGSMSSGIDDAAKNAKDKLTTFKDNAFDGIGEIFDGVKNTLGDAWDKYIIPAYKKIVDGVGKSFADIKNWLGDKKKDIQSTLDTIAKNIKSLIPDDPSPGTSSSDFATHDTGTEDNDADGVGAAANQLEREKKQQKEDAAKRTGTGGGYGGFAKQYGIGGGKSLGKSYHNNIYKKYGIGGGTGGFAKKYGIGSGGSSAGTDQSIINRLKHIQNINNATRRNSPAFKNMPQSVKNSIINSNYGIGGGGDNSAGSESEVWDYLKSKGLGDNVVAGIMGNMQQESGFNAHIIEGGGTADEINLDSNNGYGLCQWSSSRKQDLADYASANGSSSGDYKTQIDFMLHEIDTVGSYKGLIEDMKGLDANAAAVKFHEVFEGSADDAEGIAVRGSNADEIYKNKGRGDNNTSYSGSGSSSKSSKKNSDNSLFGKLGSYIQSQTDKYSSVFGDLFGSKSDSGDSKSDSKSGNGYGGKAGDISAGSAGEWELKALQKGDQGATVTSPYGEERGYEVHGGIDMGAAQGTPVYTPVDGTVADILGPGSSHGYGNMIQIKDSSGNYHLFPHLAELPGGNVGDTVSAGDQVGIVGSTGNSSGPHLHYEIDPPENFGASSGQAHLDPGSYEIPSKAIDSNNAAASSTTSTGTGGPEPNSNIDHTTLANAINTFSNGNTSAMSSMIDYTDKFDQIIVLLSSIAELLKAGSGSGSNISIPAVANVSSAMNTNKPVTSTPGKSIMNIMQGMLSLATS